jgi:hypothetical protein
MKRNLQDFFIDTVKLDERQKVDYLKSLEEMAVRSKRTGRIRKNSLQTPAKKVTKKGKVSNTGKKK